jgi:hypothetical protein
LSRDANAAGSPWRAASVASWTRRMVKNGSLPTSRGWFRQYLLLQVSCNKCATAGGAQRGDVVDASNEGQEPHWCVI